MTDTTATRMTVDIRPGESLQLQGGLVSVELVHKSGRVARLLVTAPRDVLIEKKPGNGLDGFAPSMA